MKHIWVGVLGLVLSATVTADTRQCIHQNQFNIGSSFCSGQGQDRMGGELKARQVDLEQTCRQKGHFYQFNRCQKQHVCNRSRQTGRCFSSVSN